ncbi:MAG: rhomboid family intramembrane serine protease [Bacteroidia bacterium]|nr:rhomboid family intramembrane serine protease [Bacteroidia bacterium]
MLDELRHELKFGNVLTRLIILNVAVFIIINLTGVFISLGGNNSRFTETVNGYFAMYSGWKSFLAHPWGIITYQFVHSGILHLLFNMLWLYWMGRIFMEFLGSRKLLSVYLIGGMTGAVLFMTAYQALPLFSGIREFGSVIGASGSVLAITVAAATLVPDYSIGLLFFGQVKLKYLAVAAVVLDLLSMAGPNAGGHIAHLGGALFGFIYVKQLRSRTNIGAWMDSLTTFIENLFSKNKPVMRVVHRKKNAEVTDQETIDRILDKISQSGYESLTSAEKEILFKASKK